MLRRFGSMLCCLWFKMQIKTRWERILWSLLWSSNMQVLLWMWHGSTWSLPLPKHKTCTAGLGPCSEACNVQWCDENCAAKYGQGTCSELGLYRFCVCTFNCLSFSSERIDNYCKSEIKSSSFYLFLLFDLHVIDSSLVVTRTSWKFQCS